MSVADLTWNKKPAWEKAVLFLFPTIELEGTLWQNLWGEERRQLFKVKMRILFAIAAVGYVLHFFVVDWPAQVQPLNLWIMYRFGLAACFLMGVVLTYTRFIENSRLYWLPYVTIGFVACYFQAQSMLWDHRVPFFFAVVLPIILVGVYGFSLVPSLFLIAGTFAVIFQPIVEAMIADPEGSRTIVSSFVLGVASTFIMRSNYAKDVKTFIRRQELIQERQKVIEGQKELTNQLKGFLPSVIFERIISFNKRQNMTMTQATDEVIRPRKKVVACIHSDIRSFTRNSKELDAYLLDRAIPNIQVMTEISESRRGISRLVGDLILSYFDQEDPYFSLLLAIDCGFEITERNNHFNARNKDAHGIQRNVIVSFGPCIVGNIGAADHAREITPLGPPINLINRMDALIKNDRGALNLDLNSTLILTKTAADSLVALLPELEVKYFDLNLYGLTIRDFPEEKTIVSLKCSEKNKSLILERLTMYESALKKDEGKFGDIGKKEDVYDYAS